MKFGSTKKKLKKSKTVRKHLKKWREGEIERERRKVMKKKRGREKRGSERERK